MALTPESQNPSARRVDDHDDAISADELAAQIIAELRPTMSLEELEDFLTERLPGIPAIDRRVLSLVRAHRLLVARF